MSFNGLVQIMVVGSDGFIGVLKYIVESVCIYYEDFYYILFL